MARHRDPADVAVVVITLRALHGWDQEGLAAAAGLSPSSISRYEAGTTTPTRKTMARLVAAAGLPDFMVERLFAWVRAARGVVATPREAAAGVVDALCAEYSDGMAAAVRASAALVPGAEPGLAAVPWSRKPVPAADDRRKAPALWALLQRRSASERRLLVEDTQEYRSWSLCELLCAESVQAAADSAERSLELAELALFIARRAPGEEAWRCRLQGYAAAHLANARRVGSDHPGAEEAFARAAKLWQAGAPADPGLLSAAQVLSLEASLRIDQCRLREAAPLLDRALAADSGALRTNLLIKRARLLEWSGDYEAALAMLGHAAPQVSERLEPRQRLMLRINPALLLCHLGRYDEAEALLPEIRPLTAELGNELDGLRLRWLEGRIAAGLGRTAEALMALAEVRNGFADLDIAYDAALATLELAVLYLEQERTREVKELALEMAPIFQAQGVHREALAALRLFFEAAEKEALTVELARRVVEFLYRAQHDPALRFAG